MGKEIIKSAEIEGYAGILLDVKYLLEKAKHLAYKSVDNIRVQTYWQIGERLERELLNHKTRADYGKNLISRLSNDLGFDERLIYRMLQFYEFYPILSQVATELSWSHYIELLSVKDKDERKLYESLSISNSWSRTILREEIRRQTAKRYKKGAIKLSPKATKLIPQDIFKSTYNFDFLNINDIFYMTSGISCMAKNFKDNWMDNCPKKWTIIK